MVQGAGRQHVWQGLAQGVFPLRALLFAALAGMVVLLGLHLLRAQSEARDGAAHEEAKRAAALAVRLVEAQARRMVESGLEALVLRLHGTPDVADALRQVSVAASMELVTLHAGTRRLFPPEDLARATPFEAARLTALDPVLERLRAASIGTPVFGVAQGHLRLGGCRPLEGQETLCLVLGEQGALEVLETALAPALPGAARFVALSDENGTPRWGKPGPGEEIILAAPLAGWRLSLSLAPLGFGMAQALPLGLLIGLLAALALLWRAMGVEARRAQAAARLSHDLRTPLANLRLYAALIVAARPEDAALHSQCAVIEAEVARLSALAETLLRAARGEPGAAPLEEQAGRLIELTLVRYRPLVEAAGCSLDFEPADWRGVLRDAAAFERCLVNLIDNLCCHAPGVRAKIALRVEAGLLVMDFTHPRIATGDTAGFGMGLGIVEALAQDAGGAFSDRSNAALIHFSLRWPLRGEA